MFTHKTRQAFAGVAVDLIDTLRIISTWITITFVDINFTIKSRRSRSTKTLISVNQILTGPAVLTRIGIALVYLGLT